MIGDAALALLLLNRSWIDVAKFALLQSVDPGFQAERLLTMRC